MQWVDIFIKLWCFVYNGWIFIKLWCFICNGWKDWLNSDVSYASGWLNSDVLYAWGGKIDWTLMFYMHGVERSIELWCFISMGWKDWLNSDVSYAREWLNSDVLYARGGKINWILMFYIYAWGGKIDWTLMFMCMGWKDWLNSDVSYARGFLQVFCNFITIYEKSFLKFFKRM